jgi:hypothetical protein
VSAIAQLPQLVWHVPIVTLGPSVSACYPIDQLGCDARPAGCQTDASFQHIANAKLAADLPDIARSAFVGEARLPGDDKQLREPRQFPNDMLRDAVTEVVLARVLQRFMNGSTAIDRLSGNARGAFCGAHRQIQNDKIGTRTASGVSDLRDHAGRDLRLVRSL